MWLLPYNYLVLRIAYHDPPNHTVGTSDARKIAQALALLAVHGSTAYLTMRNQVLACRTSRLSTELSQTVSGLSPIGSSVLCRSLSYIGKRSLL